MTKTLAMKEAELRLGKEITKQTLIDLYCELGDHNKVAEKLEVSRQTYFSWRLRLGLTDDELLAARVERERARKAMEANDGD